MVIPAGTSQRLLLDCVDLILTRYISTQYFSFQGSSQITQGLILLLSAIILPIFVFALICVANTTCQVFHLREEVGGEGHRDLVLIHKKFFYAQIQTFPPTPNLFF